MCANTHWRCDMDQGHLAAALDFESIHELGMSVFFSSSSIATRLNIDAIVPKVERVRDRSKESERRIETQYSQGSMPVASLIGHAESAQAPNTAVQRLRRWTLFGTLVYLWHINHIL